MKCMKNERLEAYQVKKLLKKFEETLREKIGSEMRVFGRWRDKAIKREIKRQEVRIAQGKIYKTLVKLDRWRCRGRRQAKCWGFCHRQIQVSRKCRGTKTLDTWDKAQLINQMSRSYRGDRNSLDRSTRCRGGVKIVIRKSMEARQIAKCQRGVELAFKISFLRREKHRHECN